MIRRLHAFLCVACCMLLSVSSLAQLNASFTSNIVSGCSPIVVNYTNTSSGTSPTTTYLWKLGNGATSNLQNPSTTYINAGNYNVELIITDAGVSDTLKINNYINVIAAPTVSFHADDSSASCPPKTVHFTNTSVNNSPGSATYQWDFGDGTSSTSQSPTHTYTQNGNFNVTLVVTNSLGCSKTLVKTNYIQLISPPVADFTATNASSCGVPATVNFTNTTTGATSYLWNFGNNTTSTATNPNKTYNTAGSYTITLIATNSAGCKDTIVKPAFVNIGNLDASFTKSASTVCEGVPIVFTNTSTPGPGTSVWDFGDGTSTTSTNASHAYTAAGTYTVKLVVTYTNCVDSATQTVTINALPVADFTGSPTYSCSAPLTVNFTNTSTGGPGLSYAWTFGPPGAISASTNPSYTYNNNGTFNVRLIATSSNGCVDTIVKNNFVRVGAPTGNITANPNTGCTPLPVQFSSNNINATITSYSWDFGDGTPTSSAANPSHTYTTAGTYTVTLTFSPGPGCSFTKTTTVTVGTLPVANFTAVPAIVCPEQNVTLTSTSTNATTTTFYVYPAGTPFNQGSVYQGPVFVGPIGSPGIYSVTLIASNGGCTDTLTIPNMITVQLPLASFTTAYSCTNRKKVNFTNTSVGGSTYSWDFGDGTPTSTQTNPAHTYANFGTYTVTLSTFNSATGCTDTYIQTITLFPLDAQFSADDTTICKGQSVTFTAVADPNIVSYTWAFGTGSPVTTTTNTTSFVYVNSGVYTVRLVVTDTRGCTDTLTKTGYIQAGGPQADFSGTPLTGCAPLTVNFTDISTTNGVNTTTRIWAWGDGATLGGNVANPSHVYTSGTYTVKLTITDAGGCTDTITKTAYVTASAPDANFTANATTICPGQTITFTNTTTPSTGTTYAWNFGDGTTSTAANPTKTYNTAGIYTVRLIATNNGCKDTLIRTNYITVSDVNAFFTASDTFASCPPLTVDFTTLSTGATSYSWIFGNGNTSTLAAPTTTFTQAGVYTVSLIAANGTCSDTFTKTITVLGPSGTFTYSPTSGCIPLTVNFTATANNTQTYIWDMNNGVTISTIVPSLSYDYIQSGSFVPILLLSDGVSCIVPVIGTDTIKAGKIVGNFFITGNGQCGSGTVHFNDTVLQVVSSLQSISWDFGDGGTSTINDPSHFYASSGTYSVKMIMTSALGCKDTVTKNVNIKIKPTVSAGNDASICTGQTTNVQLLATGAGSGTYLWSPGATLSCTTCNNPTASPTVSTTYTVIGTLPNGCSDTDQVAVNFAALPTVTAGLDTTICSGAFTQLQAGGAATYTWSPSGTLSCNTCSNPSANPANTQTYTVTGTDTNGCSNTDQVTVNVSQLPTVSGGPNQTICAGGSATLQGTGATTYTWSPATGLSCTACASPTATPSVTTTYTVVGAGASSNACSNTAQVTVTVSPTPVITAGQAPTICAGTSVQLTATGAGTNGTYSWTPATGLSATNIANPIASPAITTTYTITGTNAAGCPGTGTITVNVNPQANVSGGSNVAICQGSNTQLQASGAATYSWSPATGLSSTTIANPVASPTVTTTYTVIGTDASGCADTAQVTVTVNTLPTVTATGAQTICPGLSAQLQAAGASTYVWTPAAGLSSTTISNPIASPTATTTYVVTGTDANGCTDTAAVTITLYPQPTVSAGNNTAVCLGSGVQLAATGGTTYTWSPAATLSCALCANPIATPTATTVYTLVGTDGNGCNDTATVTVSVNQLPTVSAGLNDTICLGATTQLQASGATSYVWAPSATLDNANIANPIAAPLATTTYTVTGTDANGCVDTGAVTIVVNTLPMVTATGTASICPGLSTPLQANGATTYSWSPTAGLSNATIDNPIASPSTTTTYIVTGTDVNGCQDTGTVVVTVYPQPNINAGPDVAICIGSAITLQAAGGSNYVWLPDATLSCTSCANPVATPTVTTTYTIAGVSADGCADTGTITVTVNPLPIINAGADDTICIGTPTVLIPTGGVSYVWSPATGLSCTVCPNPSASPTATTTYVVTGTDVNGCVNTDTITVHVNPLPVVSAGPDQIICQLTGAQLQASGAVNYTWSPAAGLSCVACADPIASPTAATTYTVTGTDANGCVNIDNVTVNIFAAPSISAGANQTLCDGNSVMLQATGGVTYNWSPANDLSCITCPNPTASPTADITYTVVATDANGCIDSAQVSIDVILKNAVTFSAGDSICAGESAELFATGGDTYLWTPADGLSSTTSNTVTATPGTTTAYTVVVSQGQCFADTGIITVMVSPQPTVDAGPNRTIIAGESVTLNPVITDANIFTWTPIQTLSCSDCPTPVATPKSTTTYTIYVANDGGCNATDSVTITVKCDNSQLFMPNTFTPNGDLHNDRFFVQGKGVAMVKLFRIYTRWGEMVYEAQNVPANDPTYGWDGTYQGVQLKPDVYVYIVSAMCENGDASEHKGDISLIR